MKNQTRKRVRIMIVVQMQVLLPLFMRFLLMISGTRSVMVKREKMESERK